MVATSGCKECKLCKYHKTFHSKKRKGFGVMMMLLAIFGWGTILLEEYEIALGMILTFLFMIIGFLIDKLNTNRILKKKVKK